jgi:hypothetical protein
MTPDRIATWRRPDRTVFHQGTTIDRRPDDRSADRTADRVEQHDPTAPERPAEPGGDQLAFI